MHAGPARIADGLQADAGSDPVDRYGDRADIPLLRRGRQTLSRPVLPPPTFEAGPDPGHHTPQQADEKPAGGTEVTE